MQHAALSFTLTRREILDMAETQPHVQPHAHARMYTNAAHAGTHAHARTRTCTRRARAATRQRTSSSTTASVLLGSSAIRTFSAASSCSVELSAIYLRAIHPSIRNALGRPVGLLRTEAAAALSAALGQ